jgi:transposase
MGWKKDISPEEKAKIIAWLQVGIKSTEIAARLGRAASAIRKHIAVLKTLPLTTPPPPAKKRTGRKRKVTTNMKVRG